MYIHITYNTYFKVLFFVFFSFSLSSKVKYLCFTSILKAGCIIKRKKVFFLLPVKKIRRISLVGFFY